MEGWRGRSNGAQKKKTHSFQRTHILDSKVTPTHHKRNDAGRERREVRGKRKRGMKELDGEEKHICRGEVFSLLAPLLLYQAVYKLSNKY